ncbi:PAS domain-containing protein [Emcibacter sp.]|uniref:PAS domain-containing protein n=1 Tax=Emcibacter sp. TaxID=1979954 RepID=UPI003A8E5E78
MEVAITFTIPKGISDIEPDPLKKIFLHWQKIKGDKFMPCRKDFRPADITMLLPHVALIDVEHDPRRFRVRLVGTETVKAMGRDVTGWYLDEHPPLFPLIERYSWLVDHKSPYLYFGELIWSEKPFLNYYALGLPFSEDNDKVDIIMLGMYFVYNNK